MEKTLTEIDKSIESIIDQIDVDSNIRPIVIDGVQFNVIYKSNEIDACACSNSCGSNFSQNGSCGCSSSCGSNYSRM